GPPPMPHSKSDRNDFIQVAINYESGVLAGTIGRLKEASITAEKPLEPEQLLDLEAVSTAAHEYGHALELAYRIYGSDTLSIAQHHEKVMPINVLPDNVQNDIH